MNTKIKDEYKRIVAVMSEVTGLDERQLISTRRYPTSFYRAMMAQELRDLGHSTVDIGRLLRRDHSTVIHACLRLAEVLKIGVGYYEVVDVYTRFKKRLAAGEKELPVGEIDKLAEEYVGLHCDKRCAICSVGPSRCRFIMDEETFKAGARAQLGVMRESVEKLRSAVASCVCLCDRGENISSAVKGLEEALDGIL